MGIFTRSDYPYTRKVNLLAWTIQIIVSIIMIGLFAYIISLTSTYDFDTLLSDYGNLDWDHLLNVGAGIRIAIGALAIVLCIFEMVLISKKRMHPGVYTASTAVKSLIFSVLFILDLINLDILGIVVDGACDATALLQLIYGAKLCNQLRKGLLHSGEYHIPQAYNMEAGAAGPSYTAPAPVPANSYNPGQPQYGVAAEYKPCGEVPSTAPPSYVGGGDYKPYGAPVPGYSNEYNGAPQQQPGSYEVDGRPRA